MRDDELQLVAAIVSLAFVFVAQVCRVVAWRIVFILSVTLYIRPSTTIVRKSFEPRMTVATPACFC